MSRGVIAVDVDECLFAYLEWYAKWLPSKGWPTFDVWVMPGFGVANLLGMEPRQAKLLEMEFLVEASHGLPAMPGAAEALEVLADRFEVHAVTARVEDLAGAATRSWLDATFPGVFSGVHLLWETVDSDPVPKGEVCSRIGAKVLVDDAPANLATLDHSSCSGVLLGSWPWSDALTGPWVRCSTWPDAVEWITARDS